MGSKYRLSRWVKFRKTQGGVWKLFHAVIGSLTCISDDMHKFMSFFNRASTIEEASRHFNIIVSECSNVIDRLYSERFLVLDGDAEPLDSFREYWDINELSLRLFITERCNFKCKYCFEDSQSNGRDMTIGMIKEAVDAFVEFFHIDACCQKKIKVNIYGGEPLLKWDLLVQTVKIVNHKIGSITDNYLISLNTNGALITEEKAEYIVKNRLTVYISVDGFEEQHNSMRVYANGQGTFCDVIKGLKILLSKSDESYRKDNLAVLVTVSNHNIHEADKFLLYLSNLEIKNVSVNMAVMDMSLSCKGDNKSHYVSVNDFFNKSIELYRIGRENSMCVGGAWGRIRNAVIRGGLKFCTAVGNEFDVAVNGDVFPCPMMYEKKEEKIGRIVDGHFIEYKDNYERWSKRFAFNQADCKDCDCIGICRGACPAHSYGMKGDLYKSNCCDLYKKYVDFFVDVLPD